MQINHRYTDTMDTSRGVVPFDEAGNCRVYFDGTFVGKTRIPPKLFLDEARKENDPPSPLGFYGFVPWRDASRDDIE